MATLHGETDHGTVARRLSLCILKHLREKFTSYMPVSNNNITVYNSNGYILLYKLYRDFFLDPFSKCKFRHGSFVEHKS